MSVAKASKTSPAATSQNEYALRAAIVPEKPRSPSTPRTTAIHQVMTFGAESFIVASPLTLTSLRAGSDFRPGCGRGGQPAGEVACGPLFKFKIGRASWRGRGEIS